MAQPISLGRWRGLKTTSTIHNVFNILALDQRQSYADMLPPGTAHKEAVCIKRDIVISLASQASAVLLDAEYGMEAALETPGTAGLLLALDERGYSGQKTYKPLAFNKDWTVAKIKRLGASAVKMLVYYHPEAGSITEETEAVIKAVCDKCHKYDIALFLGPMLYNLDPTESKTQTAQKRPDLICKMAQRLSKLDPDVLKLEFPVDVDFDDNPGSWYEACKTLSDSCEVPWVLLSAGIDFDLFERQARVACQAGASGFLAGRAIWKEALPMPQERRQRFLINMGRDRMRTLTEIANTAAKPWTHFYAPVEITDRWYESYDTVSG